MAAIFASLQSVTASNAPFCATCGTILQLPDTNRIKCEGCGAVCKFTGVCVCVCFPFCVLCAVCRVRAAPIHLAALKRGGRASRRR